MTMHTIEGFIYFEQDPAYRELEWSKPLIGFMEYEPSPEIWPHRVVIQKHSFEIEVPDDFDPTAPLIANLEEQKRKLQLELAHKLMTIDEQISKLQALPCSVSA